MKSSLKKLLIESESEYISGDIFSMKVKVYLHNVSGDISIFVGLMKWGSLRLDWFLLREFTLKVLVVMIQPKSDSVGES